MKYKVENRRTFFITSVVDAYFAIIRVRTDVLYCSIFFLPLTNHFNGHKRWWNEMNWSFKQIKSIPLRYRSPLVSKNYKKTHYWALLLHWLTCSFITIKIGTVLYSESSPHPPSCCREYSRAADYSPQEMHHLLLLSSVCWKLWCPAVLWNFHD